jgi:hypothetical protein
LKLFLEVKYNNAGRYLFFNFSKLNKIHFTHIYVS